MAEQGSNELRLRSLMRAAQEGNAASYDLLLHECIPVIRGFIRSRTQKLSHQDVEDIVQDVLLSVHEARATYDPSRAFIPWLITIARNRLVDRGRQAARKSKNEVSVEKYPETFSTVSTNISAEMSSDVRALQEAIADLPDKQRRVLELTKIHGFSLEEASAETAMSIAAVKVTVHRAVKTLRLKFTKGNQ